MTRGKLVGSIIATIITVQPVTKRSKKVLLSPTSSRFSWLKNRP
jgi:hypothetical protein